MWGGIACNIKSSDISKNGFDIIRYWSALSVMLLHFTGYALKLTTEDSRLCFIKLIRKLVTFFPAVVVLFAISGFLISMSFERSCSKKEFFVKRIARLYPELWFCTLVNLFVLLILAKDFLDKSIITWAATQIFGIANTPHCLASFATGSVNGALWTIFVEIQLYVFLGICYNWLKKKSMLQWIVILIMCAALNFLAQLFSTHINNSITKLLERIFVPYMLWFMIGVFCYVHKEKIVDRLVRWVIPIGALYVAIKLCPYSIPGYYTSLLIGCVCPFFVIALGFRIPKIRIKCDLTYGMFLYHWIALNIIVYFDWFNKVSFAMTILFFVSFTMFFSYLSWKYIGGLSKGLILRVK